MSPVRSRASKVILTAVMIAVIFTVGVLTGSLIVMKGGAESTDSGASTNHVTVLLTLQVYKDGKLIKVYRKVNDPFTTNFAKFLCYMFYHATEGVTPPYSLTDVEGREVYFSKGWSGPFSEGGGEVYIAIGSGLAPFSVDRYHLVDEVARAGVSTPTLSRVGNAMNITFSASFTFPSDTQVSEAGVLIGLNAGYGGTSYFLMLYDTFEPISVPAGGQLVVTYVIMVNQ